MTASVRATNGAHSNSFTIPHTFTVGMQLGTLTENNFPELFRVTDA